MSHHRRKVSYDRNHFEVKDALTRIGSSVIDMASLGNDISDLIAVDMRSAVLFEIKVKGGRFDLGQLKYLANFRGYAAFCTSGEEAIRIKREPEKYALTEKQKLLILKLVAGYEREYDLKERATGKKIKRRRVTVERFETDFESAL